MRERKIEKERDIRERIRENRRIIVKKRGKMREKRLSIKIHLLSLPLPPANLLFMLINFFIHP